MENTTYRKHYIPLESNPDVFSQLAGKLGLSSSLVFQDVYALDDSCLAFVPRPVLALILVFPASELYEEQKTQKEKSQVEEYHKSGEEEKAIWFRQTINNACGLYGILHAVSNGGARVHICK